MPERTRRIRTRTASVLWGLASAAVLVVMVVADHAVGRDTILIPLYGAAALLASLGVGVRATIAMAVAAVLAAVGMGLDQEIFDRTQGAVQILAVALAGNFAVWIAFLRTRLEQGLVRERFLAEAGVLLAGSTDLPETLRRVAQLAVPELADWSAVDLLTSDGGIDRAAVAHVDPEKIRFARELQERYPASIDDPSGLGHVLRTGESEFYPDIPRGLIESRAQDAEHLELIRQVDIRSGLSVPLVAGDRILGALTWVTAESDRRMTEADLRLAQVVAGRCGLAIANAQARQELDEAFGLLDVIFDRAPVGLALFDPELRYLRLNEHLAEINGLPVGEHTGRHISDVLPNMDPEVVESFERVLEGGEVIATEVVGETPAQPGTMRTWTMSTWPVRRRGSQEIIGVGSVVSEITAQRAADRALRAQTDRYETLLLALSEVGEGMIVLEEDRLVYANPAFEQLSGYALEELRAMDDVFDLAVDAVRDDARERARARVERGEVDPHYALTIRRRDGELVELEIAGVPLEVDGHHQLVVVGRDVTDRRRAEADRETALRRTAFLAEASERFDEVLDVERMVTIAAQLSVRDFADACTITLHGGQVSAAAGIEPAEAPVALMLPLRARGQRIGTMALGFRSEPDPERERELRAIFGDLARRTALALDNARLYQERSAVARTLQRSLLPPELPSLPDLQLAARYVASGEGNDVGGDFYDCFATGTGEWALVIGDVCGKGAEAAAITALARYTIRAAVLHTREPHEVLGELNEAILRQGLEYRFCTVLYAAVRPRPGGADVRLSSGGHPLPLIVRAGGAVVPAGRPGTLLGIVPDPHLASDDIALEAGDALVLYTDGVIEATPTDDRFGPEKLEAFAAGLAGRDAADIANAIEREVLDIQQGAPRDDVAVLVLRVPPGGGASFAAARGGVAASA